MKPSIRNRKKKRETGVSVLENRQKNKKNCTAVINNEKRLFKRDEIGTSPSFVERSILGSTIEEVFLTSDLTRDIQR